LNQVNIFEQVGRGHTDVGREDECLDRDLRVDKSAVTVLHQLDWELDGPLVRRNSSETHARMSRMQLHGQISQYELFALREFHTM